MCYSKEFLPIILDENVKASSTPNENVEASSTPKSVLSARQRDVLLLEEVKEDKTFRKDRTHASKDSTKCFADGFQVFTHFRKEL